MLNTVIGKVFSHPVTKVEYGQIRIPPTPTTFSTLNGTSYDAVAEDGCGNYFTKTEDSAREFKLDSQLGTIEPGKIAYLVLLKKSPLESVDAYDSIVTVWVHGRSVSRDSLTANASK